MSYSDAERLAQNAAVAASRARNTSDDVAIEELARSVEMLSRALAELAGSIRRDS